MIATTICVFAYFRIARILLVSVPSYLAFLVGNATGHKLCFAACRSGLKLQLVVPAAPGSTRPSLYLYRVSEMLSLRLIKASTPPTYQIATEPLARATRYSPGLDGYVIGGVLCSMQLPRAELLPILFAVHKRVKRTLICGDYNGIPHLLIYDCALVSPA